MGWLSLKGKSAGAIIVTKWVLPFQMSKYATVEVKIYWIRVTLDGFYTKSISEQTFLRLLIMFLQFRRTKIRMDKGRYSLGV